MNLKNKKGITFIALVVTIIVLLILAGVSVSLLTGQNGILNRAAEAKEKTEEAQKEEEKTLQGYEDIMDQYTGNLPSREETKPYFPNSTFSYKEGDLSTGLVIKDSNDNEYVWVEVPTTIYDNTEYNSNGAKKPSNSENYANIEVCLKAYTADYANSSYSDTKSNFSEQYQAMLKSVYTNGGFWIGRYEAGLKGDTPRTSYTEISASDRAVVQQNKIPYNYVKRDEAQTLAQKMDYGDCKGSLIFGIQWDLVLKYIETKNPAQKSNLLTNSTSIGNYYNSSIELKRGKFAQNGALSKWYNFNSDEKSNLVEKSQKKGQSSNSNAILLTTGATEATNLQNIYDIAGNVWEWTLEFYTTSSPCVYRGGSCVDDGSYYPAKSRYSDNTSGSNHHIRFSRRTMEVALNSDGEELE